MLAIISIKAFDLHFFHIVFVYFFYLFIFCICVSTILGQSAEGVKVQQGMFWGPRSGVRWTRSGGPGLVDIIFVQHFSWKVILKLIKFFFDIEKPIEIEQSGPTEISHQTFTILLILHKNKPLNAS